MSPFRPIRAFRNRIRVTVVNVRKTLIWYERRGYTLTGETQLFPYGDERFGRPLRDDLHFVVLEKELVLLQQAVPGDGVYQADKTFADTIRTLCFERLF